MKKHLIGFTYSTYGKSTCCNIKANADNDAPYAIYTDFTQVSKGYQSFFAASRELEKWLSRFTEFGHTITSTNHGAPADVPVISYGDFNKESFMNHYRTGRYTA